MTIREAEELLDNAMCGDQGKEKFVVPGLKQLEKIGIMNLHIVYYDGGWSTQPIVTEILRQNPHGYLASVLLMVVEARVARDGYSKETLFNMYNLVE